MLVCMLKFALQYLAPYHRTPGIYASRKLAGCLCGPLRMAFLVDKRFILLLPFEKTIVPNSGPLRTRSYAAGHHSRPVIRLWYAHMHVLRHRSYSPYRRSLCPAARDFFLLGGLGYHH